MQDIVDLADKLIYEEASDWITYSKCFSGLQRKKEYDALFLLYVIWINKKIDGLGALQVGQVQSSGILNF